MRVLHVLTQRPALTGSGITLDALARCAAADGVEQRAVVGVPEGADVAVAGLAPEHVRPLRFETAALPFPVPGMSDVMPYRSTVFASMDADMVATYRTAWRDHLAGVLDDFAPDVIHAHHLWLVGAMLKDLAPHTPVLSHCQATGLRQMELCPHLAEDVRRGVRRNDVVAVLHGGHSTRVREILDLPAARIRLVGTGYRNDLFTVRVGGDRRDRVLYVGKYSAAKGLPWLLDAVEALARRRPGLVLHVAGSGAGAEAAALRDRMDALAPRVVMHGAVDQATLSDLMNRCAVCVLPSFYEGVPLVLAEALACGCRLVATDLPGVVDQLAGPCGEALELVPTPRLIGVDVPEPADLSAFVAALAVALDRALDAPPPDDPGAVLAPFTWSAVYARVRTIWTELAGGNLR